MKQEILGSNKDDHFKVIQEMHKAGHTYYKIADFLNGVGIVQDNGNPIHDKAISKFMLENGYRIKTMKTAPPIKNSVLAEIDAILKDRKLSRLMKLSLISKWVE